MTEERILELEAENRELKKKMEARLRHIRDIESALKRRKRILDIFRSRGDLAGPVSTILDVLTSRGAVVGGGFIVIRRCKKTGLLQPSLTPYEHISQSRAKSESDRISEKYSDKYDFEVWRKI